MITLVGGTMFLMWLGEQITARGVGNGTSLIIFAGIVANLPHALANLLELGRTGALSPVFILAFVVIAVAVIAFIVFMERAQRRVVIQYPKRQVGQRMFGGDSTHMPLKVNTLGRDPADLRQLDPADPGDDRRLLAGDRPEPGSAWIGQQLGARRSRCTWSPMPAMIIFFSLFLHRRRVQPAGDGRQPEEIRRLHPRHPARARNTADYFDTILTRLTTVGALYLCARLPAAGDPDQPLRRAVLLRRHQPDDHRLGHHGHGDADPVAPAGAPV